jgi:hypothetical protein
MYRNCATVWGTEGAYRSDDGRIPRCDARRNSHIVGADRDEPAIANLKFTMECNQAFSLAAVLGAIPSTTEDENHGMLCL